MEFLRNFTHEFIRLSMEMSFWLLIGFLFAGVLHAYINRETIARYIGKSDFKSIFTAALLGVPLPLCSCGVIPTALAIHKGGASKSASISFLIATPQTGVDSILATYSLLGLPFAIIRPVVALLTGILGGYASTFVERKESSTLHSPTLPILESESKRRFSVWEALRYGFSEFMDDLSKWLLIGLSLAALMSVIIPDDFFQTQVANPFLQMLIVLAAAIPIYVCATGSIPIAMVLMMKGLSPGAALVFLMAGPAINIASITVIGKALGRKALISYILSIALGAILAGLFIDYVLPADLFILSGTEMAHAGHEHRFLPEWLEITSAIVLGVLILSSFIRKSNIIPKIYTMLFSSSQSNTITLKVSGMTCNHCKMRVEKAIRKLDKIEFVEADVNAETVKITGNELDLVQIQHEIESNGYEFHGKIS